MKRRSFFKFSLATALTSLMKPESIFGMQNHEISTREAKTEPVVISTWSHGIEANEEAWKVLENNGKSLDAVEQGVKITEADLSNRSVGIGGRPDRDGHVTLDACIMDERSRCGAVAYLEGIQHPISVARAVMEKTQHVMLVGSGAKAFALDYGFETCKTPIKEVKKDWKAWKKENKEAF